MPKKFSPELRDRTVLWSGGYAEPVKPPPAPHHVIAQQILGLALQQRVTTRDDVYRDLAAFAPLAAAEGEAILDHMIENFFLVQDGLLLMVGPAAERRYGGMHFRDLMAVLTAAPQFTMLHGRNHAVVRCDAAGDPESNGAGSGTRDEW